MGDSSHRILLLLVLLRKIEPPLCAESRRTPSLVDELLNEIYVRFGGSECSRGSFSGVTTDDHDTSPSHSVAGGGGAGGGVGGSHHIRSGGSQESDEFTEYSTTSERPAPRYRPSSGQLSQLDTLFDEKSRQKARERRLREKGMRNSYDCKICQKKREL